MLPLSTGELILSGPLLVAAAVAAVAGMVSFFSPCCLPLVPGYLSYVAGVSGAELTGQVPVAPAAETAAATATPRPEGVGRAPWPEGAGGVSATAALISTAAAAAPAAPPRRRGRTVASAVLFVAECWESSRSHWG
jgi:cytochrome c-type biogenesis protein